MKVKINNDFNDVIISTIIDIFEDILLEFCSKKKKANNSVFGNFQCRKCKQILISVKLAKTFVP